MLAMDKFEEAIRSIEGAPEVPAIFVDNLKSMKKFLDEHGITSYGGSAEKSPLLIFWGIEVKESHLCPRDFYMLEYNDRLEYYPFSGEDGYMIKKSNINFCKEIRR